MSDLLFAVSALITIATIGLCLIGIFGVKGINR